MKPAGIDHVVLTVQDVEASAAFYSRVLNMELRIFGEGRVALHAGRFKLNLHQAGDEGILLVADSVQPGSLDICFVTNASPDETMAHLRREGIDIIAGPVTRSGARGAMTSFYFRDPDANLIEVSSYPPPSVRRSDRAVEDDAWIESFLENAASCVIGTIEDGQASLISNLFVYDRIERILFFHTAGRGQTRAILEADPAVTISVFEMGRLLPAAVVTDYTVEYASIVIHGRAAIVTDAERIRRAFGLQMMKYFPQHRPGVKYADFTDEEAARATVYEVTIDRWSAKRNEGMPSHGAAAFYGWRYFDHPHEIQPNGQDNSIDHAVDQRDDKLEVRVSRGLGREQTMQSRRVNVFFYGSYIDERVLTEHGFQPDDVRVAELRGYDVRIDPLTRLVQDADHSVFGILCRATHGELDALYASPWMKAYLPEPIIVTLADGTTMPALTWLPDGPVVSATQPPGYVEGIQAAGRDHGFPEWYLKRLATFRTADNGSHE